MKGRINRMGGLVVYIARVTKGILLTSVRVY